MIHSELDVLIKPPVAGIILTRLNDGAEPIVNSSRRETKAELLHQVEDSNSVHMLGHEVTRVVLAWDLNELDAAIGCMILYPPKSH